MVRNHVMHQHNNNNHHHHHHETPTKAKVTAPPKLVESEYAHHQPRSKKVSPQHSHLPQKQHHQRVKSNPIVAPANSKTNVKMLPPSKQIAT